MCTAFSASKPFGCELVCRVDGGQPKLAATSVGESVQAVGGSDDELASFANEFVALDRECRLASFNHKHFCVRMPMHPRAAPTCTMHQDQGDRQIKRLPCRTPS